MRIILDAVDGRALQELKSFGSSIGLFRLSDVFRLMVAIFKECTFQKPSIDLFTSGSYYGYVVMVSCKRVCVLG